MQCPGKRERIFFPRYALALVCTSVFALSLPGAHAATSWVVDAYLKASNPDAYHIAATSVAIDGDTLVIGAPGEASNATGVNGDASDDSAPAAGAVYVFTRSAGIWSQQAYIKASNTDAEDRFGASVAIDGDTLVVGALGETSNATGVNGDQDDDSAYAAGAVYIFTRSAGVWSQQAYIKASNTSANDLFGGSLAISGDTVVVGAAGEAGDATGVDGDQNDNLLFPTGAAYVFTRSADVWSQQAYLKASNTDVLDLFGYAVAIDGDSVLIGAIGEASSATGVEGDQSDNSLYGAGAVYVFTRNADVWSQQAYIKASNTDGSDQFGYSLAISGDTALIGASYESSNATGVSGDQSDNSAAQAGAVYVFTRNTDVWSQQAYIKAANPDAGDLFGYSLAVDGDRAIIGAIGESSSATIVNGAQADDSAYAAGAAYVFTRSADVWSQQAYLKAANSEANDAFGTSLDISGDTLLIGASLEDSNAAGVDGDQDDNSADDAGAAYVLLATPTTTFTVSGTLNGLAAGQTLVLQNNTDDDLILDANSAFHFATALNDTSAYEVTVLNQPTGQICTVSNGSGIIDDADISDVRVSCVSDELIFADQFE